MQVVQLGRCARLPRRQSPHFNGQFVPGVRWAWHFTRLSAHSCCRLIVGNTYSLQAGLCWGWCWCCFWCWWWWCSCCYATKVKDKTWANSIFQDKGDETSGENQLEKLLWALELAFWDIDKLTAWSILVLQSSGADCTMVHKCANAFLNWFWGWASCSRISVQNVSLVSRALQDSAMLLIQKYTKFLVLQDCGHGQFLKG